MKKLIAIFIPVILLLTGCNKQNPLKESVSRIRDNCFYGEDSDYSLYIYPEIRETPMIADGKINPTKQQVIIKLSVKNGKQGQYTVKFTTDKEYSDTFNFSAISDSYVTAIDVEKLPDKPFIATIDSEDKRSEVEVKSLLKSDTISADEALYAAYKAKKQYVDELSKNGCFKGEVYIRLIAKGDNNFWYVGFVTENSTLSLLLDGKGNLLEEKTIPNPL